MTDDLTPEAVKALRQDAILAAKTLADMGQFETGQAILNECATLATAYLAMVEENERLRKRVEAARKAIGAHAEPISGTPYTCGSRAWLEVFDRATEGQT